MLSVCVTVTTASSLIGGRSSALTVLQFLSRVTPDETATTAAGDDGAEARK